LGVKRDAYQSSAGQFSVDNLALREMKQPHRGQRDVFFKPFPLVAFSLSGQELQSSNRLRYSSLETYLEGLARS
jgi:hypothetical protein